MSFWTSYALSYCWYSIVYMGIFRNSYHTIPIIWTYLHWTWNCNLCHWMHPLLQRISGLWYQIKGISKEGSCYWGPENFEASKPDTMDAGWAWNLRRIQGTCNANTQHKWVGSFTAITKPLKLLNTFVYLFELVHISCVNVATISPLFLHCIFPQVVSRQQISTATRFCFFCSRIFFGLSLYFNFPIGL